MTRVYYKEAVGAFVVFDVTRGSTFEAVSKWKHDLDSKVKLANGSPIPSVLLANKCDQKNESSNNTALMDTFCKETGFLGWFETSAKVSSCFTSFSILKASLQMKFTIRLQFRPGYCTTKLPMLSLINSS